MNTRVDTAKRIRPRAWLAALLLVLAQAAMAVHALENDHSLTGANKDLCLVCLHGERHHGAPPPDAVPLNGPAKVSFIVLPLPLDRHAACACSRAHGARAPPLHSSAA